jgi:predicted nuclease of restriction endonuclease-like RecB superfamily
VIELGREGVWVPDYRAVHKPSGLDVFVEVVGFWRKASLDRLLRLLPQLGPDRFVLLISDKLRVDEESLGDVPTPVLRFREIPSASELASLLDTFVKRDDSGRLF